MSDYPVALMPQKRKQPKPKTAARRIAGSSELKVLFVFLAGILVTLLWPSTGISFVVVEIPGKGKGVIAARDIQQGELLIREKPLFTLPREGSSPIIISGSPANASCTSRGVSAGRYTWTTVQVAFSRTRRVLQFVLCESGPQPISRTTRLRGSCCSGNNRNKRDCCRRPRNWCFPVNCKVESRVLQCIQFRLFLERTRGSPRRARSQICQER